MFASTSVATLLSETVGDGERQFAAASHTWQEVIDFGSSYNGDNLNRSLWLVTRNDGLAVPGSITTMLFHYREPLLRLYPSDQQLLLAALNGMTDQELSDRLGLHLGTIKKDGFPYLTESVTPSLACRKSMVTTMVISGVHRKGIGYWPMYGNILRNSDHSEFARAIRIDMLWNWGIIGREEILNNSVHNRCSP